MSNKVGILMWTSALVLFSSILLHHYYPDVVEQYMDQHPFIKKYWLQIYSFMKEKPVSPLNIKLKAKESVIRPPNIAALKELQPGEVLFTPEELKLYDGSKGSKGLYLALLGRIYDVRKGEQHYGPDGGYHHFAGRDATKSFVSGDFTPEGLSDDVSGLSSSQMLSIEEWVNFYNKDYFFVGRLIGRYYDEKGNPTKELENAYIAIEKGKKDKQAEEKEKLQFPSCNSEWSKDKGGRVWCSKKSGGIDRAWVGVPRQYHNPGTGQSRCVCVHGSQLDHAYLREYKGCPSDADSCKVPD